VSNVVDPRDQDDVVVIEERDKHTLVYIAIAAVLGGAIGGLIGSIVTKSEWEPAYQALEVKLVQAKQAQTEVIVQKAEAVEKKEAELETEIVSRVTVEVDTIALQSKQEIDKAQAMVTELEKVNIEMDARIQSQLEEIEQRKLTISDLEKQVAMQANIFERSRELFQRELLIKQDLTKLQKERDVLEPRLKRFKKECDVYLDGSSFEANSSACDKHDEINSNISQIDQMIEVHKLDLRDIESISDRIGL